MASKVGSKSWNDEMYEKHATPYNGVAGFIQKKRLQKIAKAISINKPKSGNTIVEIGCEEGNLLNFLSERFPKCKFAGLDISSKALTEAKNLLPESIKLDEYDLTSGPYPFEYSPAFIVCSETLEHIPDAKSAIKNIAASARDETIIVITVPIEKYKNNIKRALVKLGVFNLFFKGIEESLSEWHVQDFSKEDILELLNPYFKVLSYDTIWLMHQIIVLQKKHQ